MKETMGKGRRMRKLGAAQGTSTSPKLTEEESRVSLAVKEEYERLGVRFGYGVSDVLVSYEDGRVDRARRTYEFIKGHRVHSQKLFGKKPTGLERQSLKLLLSQEKMLRQCALEAKDVLRQFDYRCAKTALNHYNNAKHDAKFQVVECLGCFTRRTGRGKCTHTNFWAEQPGDDEKSLFFAELLGIAPEKDDEDERRVNWCEILDETEFVRGCGLCNSEFAHPKGFKGLSWVVQQSSPDV